MKNERVILAAMVFLIIWTTILCVYHIQLMKLELAAPKKETVQIIEIDPIEKKEEVLEEKPKNHKKNTW